MMVEVDIYKKKYESLKMGDRLLVYETFGKPNSYLYAGVVESARPIFKLDNFWFTFEAIIGLIIILFCPYIYYDSYKFRKKNL